jgi:hypothetical protein
VMLTSDLLRAVALGGMAALVVTDAPAAAVYVLAAARRGDRHGLSPCPVCAAAVAGRTPEELTAANVSSSTLGEPRLLRRPRARRPPAGRSRRSGWLFLKSQRARSSGQR